MFYFYASRVHHHTKAIVGYGYDQGHGGMGGMGGMGGYY